MNYELSGSGSPVVLIHGLFGNLDNLKTLARALEKAHTVIRIDIPNHGQSEHTQKMGYDDLAFKVISLLDSLNIGRCHLVGHSMGGKIALATALYYPERVQSVIAVDISPVAYAQRHNDVFNALLSMPLPQIANRQQALQHLLQKGLDEGTSQFLLKSLAKNENGFYWKMNLRGLRECYQDLILWTVKDQVYSGPTLFVRGGDSDYIQLSHKQEILRQFPNTEAKTIQGAGHWLHAQKPVIFNKIVAEFIEKHDC
ncbi:alpha/beta fold hydrolase [Shewanella gelidii]|uniref:Esterase n=1 Tax=Shewanella gelidii TaxID=1642821 RepID=A0A917NCB9_9GAMM|nr:alpha/beta fold hydrolase [Shewanella gelidii]MCL1099054.1 alpha/beta fold hydrolase [Shewanella gelidii]GGI88517.1 esterase [Shewanella gelidii]